MPAKIAFVVFACPRHDTPPNLVDAMTDCPQCGELLMIYEYIRDIVPGVEVKRAAV